MAQFTKLDDNIRALLCCPICKSALAPDSVEFMCRTCNTAFPSVEVGGDNIFDFRIHHPLSVVPQTMRKWDSIQKKYEDYTADATARDNLQEYLDEIEAVREIYTSEFALRGNVLDVGGHQGRLRHYIADQNVPLYLCVDPLIDGFRDAGKPNLQKAYPCLSRQCNFVSCHAEYLPVIAHSFDWVHMRSVLDHFADPYMAIKEAYRVLKPGGQLLIGLAIEEKMMGVYASLSQRVLQKLRSGGVSYALKSIVSKLMSRVLPGRDDHNFRLRHDELVDLVSRTGFTVIKEHWQKPPYSYVLYLSARKINRG